MTYPKSWNEVQIAAFSYSPPEEAAEAFAAAVTNAGAAPFCVGVFNALKGVQDLDRQGLAIALGAARLINLGRWYGMAEECLDFLESRAGEYVSPE